MKAAKFKNVVRMDKKKYETLMNDSLWKINKKYELLENVIKNRS